MDNYTSGQILVQLKKRNDIEEIKLKLEMGLITPNEAIELYKKLKERYGKND